MITYRTYTPKRAALMSVTVTSTTARCYGYSPTSSLDLAWQNLFDPPRLLREFLLSTGLRQNEKSSIHTGARGNLRQSIHTASSRRYRQKQEKRKHTQNLIPPSKSLSDYSADQTIYVFPDQLVGAASVGRSINAPHDPGSIRYHALSFRARAARKYRHAPGCRRRLGRPP